MPSEYYGDQDGRPKNEDLQETKVDLRSPSETLSVQSSPTPPRDFRVDPGLSVLTGSQEPILRFPEGPLTSREQTDHDYDSMMADKPDEPPPNGEAPAGHVVLVPPQLEGDAPLTAENRNAEHKRDSATLSEAHSEPVSETKELTSRPRADSMQASTSPPLQENSSIHRNSPLRIRTIETPGDSIHIRTKKDSLSASPTLSKHTIAAAVENGQNLAPFEPPSPSAGSPQTERLPSIRQLTNSLTELAEAATQEMPRQQQAFSHHPSRSFGSATSQSPILSNRPYPASIQTSPQAYYPAGGMAHSPTSTIGDHYVTPPTYPTYAAYGHRRASMADGIPPIMPNLPSASSSGDSYGGYASSTTEGYSTNHTTPIDVGHLADGTPRPTLPPPPGLHTLPPPPPIMVPGPYKCDVPDCTAGTFQTQYLLK